MKHYHQSLIILFRLCCYFVCFSSFIRIFGQDYIMLVPDNSYTPHLLKDKLLDKSADFKQQCKGEGFYVE